jgi:hypothetical protein
MPCCDDISVADDTSTTHESLIEHSSLPWIFIRGRRLTIYDSSAILHISFTASFIKNLNYLLKYP